MRMPTDFQRRVLAGLADLEVQRAAAVNDAAAVVLEPGQYRDGQFNGVAVVAGMRGGAHPIVENALGRRPRQVEDAAVEEPVAPRKPLAVERGSQGFEPSRVLVDHVDVRHDQNLRPAEGINTGYKS